MLKAPTLTDGHWRSSKPEKQQLVCRNKALIKRGETTIGILDDDALLTIFIVHKEIYSSSDLSWWRPLVRVCRRWRRVIFASPLHLNLTIVCSSKTPVNTSLDIWPPFPIAIHYTPGEPFGEDKNVVDALELLDRVTDIRLKFLTSFQLTSFIGTMDCPSSELTYLLLESIDDKSFLPSNFLGESAPSLQTLILERIAFPTLPTLLLSTTQLVTLWLSSVSTIGYISPEVMASCLVALPNLKHLGLEFRLRKADDMDVEESSPPLSTRDILRSLISFHFEGVSKYLEYLLAQIDAPMLRTMSVTFRDDITHIPQLLRFTNCTGRLCPPIQAVLEFEFWRALLKFIPSARDGLELVIICKGSFVIPLMSLICRELLPLMSGVERLDLHCEHFLLQLNPSCSRFWGELFQSFVAVRNLYVCKDVGLNVALELQELIGEGVTVLPELRFFFLEEYQKSLDAPDPIQSFIATHKFSNHPVFVQQCTASDFNPHTFGSGKRHTWHAWVDG